MTDPANWSRQQTDSDTAQAKAIKELADFNREVLKLIDHLAKRIVAMEELYGRPDDGRPRESGLLLGKPEKADQ